MTDSCLLLFLHPLPRSLLIATTLASLNTYAQPGSVSSWGNLWVFLTGSVSWVSLKPECFHWFSLPYCLCLYNIIRHLLPTSTHLRLGGVLQLTAILFILIEHAVFCIRHWLPSFISSPKDPRISAACPYSIVLLIWLQLASANENTLYWTSCYPLLFLMT